MKLAIIFLIYNQLRAVSVLKYFRNSSNKNYSNEDVTNKYDFTEFSFPRHRLGKDSYQDAESSKDLLINGLKEIIKHEKINDETKLNIIYYFLDRVPCSKRVSEDRFNAVKGSGITNELFINLAKENAGLAQHLNLLYAILQFGEIKNIIASNDSFKSTEEVNNNFIDEIGVLVNKVISNIATTPLLDEVNKNEANGEDYEFKKDGEEILYYLNNRVIMFKDLLVTNDKANINYNKSNLDKVGKYINLIENLYKDKCNNMTIYDIQTVVCIKNSLEFVYNAIKLCYLASVKVNKQDSNAPDAENPNIIVSKMIVNTLMIYFWAMPDLNKLYECVITDENIDFWSENNMIGNIYMSKFFNINKKNFATSFPDYCNWIIESLKNRNNSIKTIKRAKLLVKYLQDNKEGIENKIANNFNAKEIIENLEPEIKQAELYLSNLQKTTDNNLNATTTSTEDNGEKNPTLDPKEINEETLNIVEEDSLDEVVQESNICIDKIIRPSSVAPYKQDESEMNNVSDSTKSVSKEQELDDEPGSDDQVRGATSSEVSDERRSNDEASINTMQSKNKATISLHKINNTESKNIKSGSDYRKPIICTIIILFIIAIFIIFNI